MFDDKVAVITGGTGTLGGVIAQALAREGVRVAALGITPEDAVTPAINAAGGDAFSLVADVLDTDSLHDTRDAVLERWGRIDYLLNFAGGNMRGATVAEGLSFFDLPPEALRSVVDLNLLGTVLPAQIFGQVMADAGQGVILNVSSMASIQPLTRVVGYSAAKAAVNNFTRWLAVHMAQEYSPAIRVNAIAPGFFIAEQNRDLLLNPATGDLTDRGQTIIAHTPMGRFGQPEDLVGAVRWLLSDDSQFVTGIVVPIDGGFSAFSGV